MRNYDFIKFGECVQWKSDADDTCRTMQVCTPPHLAISDHTKINLIPSDKNEEEEVCTSYSVSAYELFPILSPFNEGYWHALQTAVSAGADSSVASTMLRNSNLTYEECLLLMQHIPSSKEQLFPIVSSLFPKESKSVSIVFKINWQGKDYPAKDFLLFKGTKEEEEVTVSTSGLGTELIDEESGLPISDEAEMLDNDIYYYMSEEELMNLSDEEIIATLESV